MNDETRDLLDEELRRELEALESLELGSEEQSTVVSNIVDLYKLKIEEEKNELNHQEAMDEASIDEAFKKIQTEEQRKDRYFRVGLEAAGIILPLIFYGVWMRKGFRFEENGTFTSTTFKGLFNRFKPTQK